LSLAQIDALITSRIESLITKAPQSLPVSSDEVLLNSNPIINRVSDLENRVKSELATMQRNAAELQQHVQLLFDKHLDDTRSVWMQSQHSILADLETRINHDLQKRSSNSEVDKLSAYVDTHLLRINSRLEEIVLERVSTAQHLESRALSAEQSCARLVADLALRLEDSQSQVDSLSTLIRKRQQSVADTAASKIQASFAEQMKHQQQSVESTFQFIQRQIRQLNKRIKILKPKKCKCSTVTRHDRADVVVPSQAPPTSRFGATSSEFANHIRSDDKSPQTVSSLQPIHQPDIHQLPVSTSTTVPHSKPTDSQNGYAALARYGSVYFLFIFIIPCFNLAL
jgi:hypothetical protein